MSQRKQSALPKATRQGREEQGLEFVWLVAFLLPPRVRVPMGHSQKPGTSWAAM